MESFLMATQVVVPMAIMVGIGILLRIFKVSDPPTMKKVDSLIFKLTMPMLSFYNIYKTDFSLLQDVDYILYGAFGLTLVFSISMWVVPKYVHPRDTASSFGQALFRTNFLLFGTAVSQSIYGEGNIGLVALLGAVVVPLFNMQASILLEAGRNSSASVKSLLLAIVKNPTVVATFLGLAVNLSGIKLPSLVLGVVKDISGLTTPLSFLSIGVSLSFRVLPEKKWYLFTAVALRLLVIPLALMIPAILLGIRGQALCGLMILFAAPVAISSYPMAVAMGADGEFAAQCVALSTIGCLPTIFLWTFALNSLQML